MLTKRSLIVLLSVAAFLFMWQATRAQTVEPPKDAYIASAIPDSLKDNANSVVRYFWKEVSLKGPGKESVKVHQIVTILNEKGDNQAVFVLPYNKKYDNCNSIEMRVYDATGNVLKKYHKSDMYDGSATDGVSIVTDERFLGLKHTVPSYPETIETEYQEDITSALNPRSWDIQQDQQAIQYAAYKIQVDTGAGFRYKCKNITIKPAISNEGKTSSYLWEVKNLKAIKLEESAEDWRTLPVLECNLKAFQYYGFNGSFGTWKDFGKWIWDLNSQVSTMPPERVAEIKKMTDTIKTDKAKARFLYEYMQKNMRYVSIQLGIGGYQPFPATFVDEKKYGDCKALANYMRALLKAANINSYCAVINAEPNQEPADPAFPFNTFNHEILCIPFKGDTTWLECTVNTQPFGVLGSFTENRNALLITEDGGILVHTPKSTMAENQFNSTAHITLDADGGAKATLALNVTGDYRFDYIGVMTGKVDEQKEFFMRQFNIKQPNSFDISPGKDENGVKEINFNLEYDKFCDIAAGDKQFYRPHVFDLVAFTLPIEEHRTSDYYFEHPLEKTCVTTIDLPVGFEVETLPVNQSLKFAYGDYTVKYTYDTAKNQVISTASFDITNQDIPAAKYTELQEFLDAVAKAQNKKLVIKRKA